MKQDRVLFLLFAVATVTLLIVLVFSRTAGIQTSISTSTAPAPAATATGPATRPAGGWTFDDIARSDFAVSIRESELAFPTLESIHLIGIGLMFGSILMLDFRLLGAAPRLPVRRVAELFLPITWIGFILQVASGGLLFVSYADQYVRTVSFPLKMGLVLLGGANMLFFHRTTWRSAAKWDLGRKTPVGAKIAAVLSTLIWILAIVAGRSAGYERRPVLENFAIPAPAVVNAPVTGGAATILSSREYQPDTFAISITPGSSADALLTIAKGACGARTTCRVDIWEVQNDLATYRFAYTLNAAGAEKPEWDCTRFTTVPKESCLQH
jgi:hypothetical protein